MSNTDLRHSSAVGVWLNPDAAPQGRRLSPEAQKAIELAGDLGIPQAKIARLYGVSRDTVVRVIKRAKQNPGRMSRDLSQVASLQNRLIREGLEPEVVNELAAALGVLALMAAEQRRGRKPPKTCKR